MPEIDFRAVKLFHIYHILHLWYNFPIIFKGMILMNKKLQVFVSSTFTDLTEERQAAVEAILDAGHIPAGMELFKAGKSQMKTIRKWIDDSDVYMLLLGGRYGSIEEESGLSYTELEYRYALSKDMPVFAILLTDSFLFTKAATKGRDAIFEKDNIGKYDAFKEFVKTKIVKFPDNKDQISSNVHSQLNNLINDDEYTLTGWTRNITNKNLSMLLDENNLLKTQTHELQTQLDVINKKASDTLFDVMYKTFTHIEFPDHDFALPFFLSHYHECLEDRWYADGDQICSKFMFFEEMNLVKHTKYYGRERPDCYGKLIKFNITQNGIDFYKYIKRKNEK